jgi:hypothetical protein
VWRDPHPPRRWARGLLTLATATGWGVLLLYGYVDVGGFGPIPGLGDPSVRREDISAVAEAIAAFECALPSPATTTVMKWTTVR